MPAVEETAAEQEEEPVRAQPSTLREGWKILLSQFTGASARDSYWHPVLEERRQALIEASRKATA